MEIFLNCAESACAISAKSIAASPNATDAINTFPISQPFTCGVRADGDRIVRVLNPPERAGPVAQDARDQAGNQRFVAHPAEREHFHLQKTAPVSGVPKTAPNPAAMPAISSVRVCRVRPREKSG